MPTLPPGTEPSTWQASSQAQFPNSQQLLATISIISAFIGNATTEAMLGELCVGSWTNSFALCGLAGSLGAAQAVLKMLLNQPRLRQFGFNASGLASRGMLEALQHRLNTLSNIDWERPYTFTQAIFREHEVNKERKPHCCAISNIESFSPHHPHVVDDPLSVKLHGNTFWLADFSGGVVDCAYVKSFNAALRREQWLRGFFACVAGPVVTYGTNCIIQRDLATQYSTWAFMAAQLFLPLFVCFSFYNKAVLLVPTKDPRKGTEQISKHYDHSQHVVFNERYWSIDADPVYCAGSPQAEQIQPISAASLQAASSPDEAQTSLSLLNTSDAQVISPTPEGITLASVQRQVSEINLLPTPSKEPISEGFIKYWASFKNFFKVCNGKQVNKEQQESQSGCILDHIRIFSQLSRDGLSQNVENVAYCESAYRMLQGRTHYEYHKGHIYRCLGGALLSTIGVAYLCAYINYISSLSSAQFGSGLIGVWAAIQNAILVFKIITLSNSHPRSWKVEQSTGSISMMIQGVKFQVNHSHLQRGLIEEVKWDELKLRVAVVIPKRIDKIAVISIDKSGKLKLPAFLITSSDDVRFKLSLYLRKKSAERPDGSSAVKGANTKSTNNGNPGNSGGSDLKRSGEVEETGVVRYLEAKRLSDYEWSENIRGFAQLRVHDTPRAPQNKCIVLGLGITEKGAIHVGLTEKFEECEDVSDVPRLKMRTAMIRKARLSKGEPGVGFELITVHTGPYYDEDNKPISLFWYRLHSGGVSEDFCLRGYLGGMFDFTEDTCIRENIIIGNDLSSLLEDF